jgi:CubicO group peptidase (beta-lactamase class C family)
MRYQRRTFATVLATMVAVYTSICAGQTKVAGKVDGYMTATARLNRFSGTILIAKNGKVLVSKGYSLADREWNTRNSATTKFRIGSLTKQFTATAVMILQDRNLLHVTDPICKYMPRCPAAWQPITIHELLNHTSGIPDYTELPGYQETQSLPTSVQGLIDRFKQQPLKFTPGDKFEYSNSGYVLLGSIIETASGKSYQEFVEENIFRPLKMTDSGYDVNTVILARRASGYTKNGGRIENASYIDMSVPFAAGGLFSTVNGQLSGQSSDKFEYLGR